MSENIPTGSSGGPNSGSNLQVKKTKRTKYDEKLKLPTPPPDPTESKTEDTTATNKDDFMAYLDSLQKSTNNPGFSRSTSAFASVMITEDAFDHLEKLYKLMEQMLELREQNAKLHRKVRDLEHLNNLEKMHKQLTLATVAQDHYPELDKDTAFAETILESILAENGRTPALNINKSRIPAPTRLRQSILRRQRSGSTTIDKAMGGLDSNQLNSSRRASFSVDDRPISKPSSAGKVSKWTKVKAAFKWEKTSPTVGDAKSQDSGLGGMLPVNLEVARYLRVPSTSEDAGHSPADSGAAEISTPATLSTASSTEDFHRNDFKTPYEDARSSDDDQSHHNYIPRSKDGSQKSNKSFKTPWAKMKDIINTRSSFKKKQRLSSHSDDIQIDVELCSDNEDVFEEESTNISLQAGPPSPLIYPNNVYRRVDSSEIPPEIIAKYQEAIAENENSSDNNNIESKKVSKWTSVKKAFLPLPDNTFSNTSLSLPKDEIKPSEQNVNNVQEEIEKNYRQLQKKLSLEFQEKLSEWERIKQNSPGTSNPSSACGFVDDNPDPAFIKKMEEWQKIKSQPSPRASPNIQLKSEEQLPPEFRKKLEEWKKIKKTPAKSTGSMKNKLGDVPRWKSMNSPKSDQPSPPLEYPALSEDFRKKLEEWQNIKAAACTATFTSDDFEIKNVKDNNKSISPKFIRKALSPKHSKKDKDQQDKELQWFEKELSKIEKEKQRLEKERKKFLDREERLSKLRSAIVGNNKKEVLVHTPSGFYRFEGISRKFTQKLYEWEKSQGIGPESSTFALLKSSYESPETSHHSKYNTGVGTPMLVRSKSADSIVMSALNLTCPLMTHQLSSLSLNDVDELEKECLNNSKSSSLQFLGHSQDSIIQLDEPEALIVEIEDVIEETAAPLRTFPETKQQPVYQREKIKAVCESETCVSPKIRQSQSKRAQSNYNLIEDIFSVIKNLTENEYEIANCQDYSKFDVDQEQVSNLATKLINYHDIQKTLSGLLLEKVIRLQEANANVISNISKENSGLNEQNVCDIVDAIQDLSAEIFQLTNRLQSEISLNDPGNSSEAGAKAQSPFAEILKDIRTKMLDLRRRLSYVCAASDLTAPRKKRSDSKKKFSKKQDNQQSVSKDSNESSRDGRLYIKAETSNTQNQGAIKKRIKYRQKILQNKSLQDTDEDDTTDDNNVDYKRNKHKKLTRTRSISENSLWKSDKYNKSISDDKKVNLEVFIPDHTNNAQENQLIDSPVTVFIKTTRKLFTPFIESTIRLSDENRKNQQQSTILRKSTESLPQIDKNRPEQIQISETNNNTLGFNKIEKNSSSTSITHLPPLPASPTPQRKLQKEISPSIRMMLAKYNQKISEQDLSTSCKSGGSSGSASPVAWRSPISERRVKARTEKYLEELSKLSPLLGERRAVQKSASVGFISSSANNKQITMPRRDSIQDNLVKNNSDNLSRAKTIETNVVERKDLRLNLDLIKPINIDGAKHSPEIRLKKLQKAKEEFLRSSPSSADATNQSPIIDERLKFPARNRLSQISVDSGSSYDSAFAGVLIKSASASMINVEPAVYKQFDPEIHGGGYVSLPRTSKKLKDALLNGKFAFSSIASKFRKVKMRRNKDKSGAVSTLCRQSLVVDINPSTLSESRQNDLASDRDADNDKLTAAATLSDDTSTCSKTGSWIKRPKLFKR